jgi:hypothetical protein
LSAIAPHARIPVGVVVERRRATSQWVDFLWRPVALLAGAPDADPWTMLDGDDEVTRFYAGAKDIELFRSETTNYRDNLCSGTPALWVALRPSGVEPPYEIILVTADPAEGEAFTETGTDLVEAVPMPDAIRDELARFVAEHHVERQTFKRKRDRADPEALARRSRIGEGGDNE